MKWKHTIASKCRYGKIAGKLFRDAEILWDNSEADYQGSAEILAIMPDGRFAHYKWTYGSCSGCDTWEEAGYSNKEILEIMRNDTVFFDSKEHFKKYVEKLKVYKIGGERAIKLFLDLDKMEIKEINPWARKKRLVDDK